VLALNALFDRLNDGFDALGSYAASASHELRTPLAVVSNQLEVALRHPRNVEEWESIARTSLDEMGRLSVLVEALLELARAGSTTTSRRFELRDELDQTCSSLEAHVRAGGAQLLPPHDGEDIWVEGDSGLLMNAVRELVRNAARYSPKGSTVRVLVELRRDELVAIVVEDDGPGVVTGERSAIFAPLTLGRHSHGRRFARRGRAVYYPRAHRSNVALTVCQPLSVSRPTTTPVSASMFTSLMSFLVSPVGLISNE